MNRKLFVGNLAYSVTENSLHDMFSQAGNVISVKIVTDTFSGRSRGFAFVEMATDEAANRAVESLNGQELEGRALKVDFARPRENREGGRDRGGRGGGMGGGRRHR